MHLRKVGTVFKKLIQKFSIFYFKIAKSRSAAGGSASQTPGFPVVRSHSPITKMFAVQAACF